MARRVQHTDIYEERFKEQVVAYLAQTGEEMKREMQKIISSLKVSFESIKPTVSSESLKGQQQLNAEISKAKTTVNSYNETIRQNERLQKRLTAEKTKAVSENVKLTAEIKKQQQVNKQLLQEELSLDKTYKQRPGIINRMTKAVTGYVAAWLSIQTVVSLVRGLFRATTELETISFSLKAVISDSKELASTERFLIGIAQRYGVELISLSSNYVRFRAAVQDTNITLAQTKDIFDTVVKAGAVLGLHSRRIELALLAIEQMASKGTVSMEELRRQLGDQIPKAVGILAKAMNVEIAVLFKMIKANEVLAEDALPALSAGLKDAYNLENIDNVDTLAAATGRLKTETQLLVKAIKAGETLKGFQKFITREIAGVRRLTLGYVEFNSTFTTIGDEAEKNFQILKKYVSELSDDDAYTELSYFAQKYDDDINELTKSTEELTKKEAELRSLAGIGGSLALRNLQNQIIEQRRQIALKEEYYNLTLDEITVLERKIKDEQKGTSYSIELEQKLNKLKNDREELTENQIKNERAHIPINNEIAKIQNEINDILGKQNKAVKDQWDLYDIILERIRRVKFSLADATNPEGIAKMNSELSTLQTILRDLRNQDTAKILGIEQLEDENIELPPFVKDLLESIEQANNDKFNQILDERIDSIKEDSLKEQDKRFENSQWVDDWREDFGLSEEKEYQDRLSMLEKFHDAGYVSDREFLQARASLWYNKNKELINEINNLAQSIGDIFLAYNDQALIQAEQELSIHEKAVSDLENRINEEYRLKQKGEANDYDLLVAQQQKEKQLRDKAFAELKELKKKEAKIQLAQQTASLITASAKILAGTAKDPVTLLIALGAIASMIAAFQGYKAKIKSIEAEEPGFAEGTEYVKGPGTSKSDSVKARLSVGEGVIDAKTNKARIDAGLKIKDIPSAADLFNVYKLNYPDITGNRIQVSNFSELTQRMAMVDMSINKQTDYLMNQEYKFIGETSSQVIIKQGRKTIFIQKQ